MLTTHSIGDVGDFIIMKTDHGEHTARQWARCTVGQIVQIDPSTTPERYSELLRLKQFLVEAIEPYFRKPQEVLTVYNAILDVVKNSPWETSFTHPNIRSEIFLCLERNLNSIKEPS